MDLDRVVCYRAVQARDARFDGRFFTAVRTTGIYCRPICPARTPKLENVAFFPTRAAAQEAGYRPCLRCRPEASPDLDGWRTASSTVSRALALIADGALDGETPTSATSRRGSASASASSGASSATSSAPRHRGSPRRAGAVREAAPPRDEAEHDRRRVRGGLRQRASVQRHVPRLYGRPPSALRRRRRGRRDRRRSRFGRHPPADLRARRTTGPSIIALLGGRGRSPASRSVERRRYRRTIELDGRHGTIEVRHGERRRRARGDDPLPAIRAPCPSIVARIRRVFDLGADVSVITRSSRRIPQLGRLCVDAPGPARAGGVGRLRARGSRGPRPADHRRRRATARPARLRRDVRRAAARVPEVTAAGLTRVFPRPARLAGRIWRYSGCRARRPPRSRPGGCRGR